MIQDQKSAADRVLQDQKAAADRLLQAQKFMGEIDADLRKRRIDAYTPLWKATALLPQWPRATDVTYAKLQELSVTLRTWYFDVGGMYFPTQPGRMPTHRSRTCFRNWVIQVDPAR
jgi:hypothetical protein